MPPKLRIVGSCASGCGACCKILGLPWPGADPRFNFNEQAHTVTIPMPEGDVSNFTRFLAVRGATFDAAQRTVTVPHDAVEQPYKLTLYGPAHMKILMLKSKCPQLQDDLTCAIHDSPELPQVCRDYPTPLDDLLVGCTYTRTMEADDGRSLPAHV